MKITAAAFLFILAVVGMNPATAQEADDNPFFNPGSDYIVHFAGETPFRQTKGVPLTAEDLKPQGNGVQIKSASVTYGITVFTVVRHGVGSWYLLEHPKKIEDSFKWNFKRLALAALTPDGVKNLSKSDQGLKKLADLRKQAEEEIETTRTWVNIDHAVAILSPPTTPIDYEVKVGVAQTK